MDRQKELNPSIIKIEWTARPIDVVEHLEILETEILAHNRLDPLEEHWRIVRFQAWIRTLTK